MMAGVYAVQGAWWPMLAVHLQDQHVEGRARGWIFATMAIACLLTPLGVGQIADRKMPAQRLLALIYALGTGLLALMASGAVRGAWPTFVLLLAYWLLTAPGLGLCAAIALRHLERPSHEFGGVRLWGTVGWMAIGWVVTAAMALRGAGLSGRGAHEAFAVAAVVSAAFAIYALSLPHTPPLAHKPGAGRRGLNLGQVRALLGRPTVGVFLALAFGVSLTSPYVYQVVPAHLATRGLPRPWIASAMSLGQILEVAALALLPGVIGRVGYRGAMTLGICAWMSYYAVLSLRLPLPLGLIGLPLQGLAIAFFHVTGPMYLDRQSPPDLRATAQGLYVMTTSGLGQLVGSLVAGEVVSLAEGTTAAVFLVPLAIDAAMLVALLVAFRGDRMGDGPSEGAQPEFSRSPSAPARAQVLAAGHGEGE
jgi:MFS family permease